MRLLVRALARAGHSIGHRQWQASVATNPALPGQGAGPWQQPAAWAVNRMLCAPPSGADDAAAGTASQEAGTSPEGVHPRPDGASDAPPAASGEGSVAGQPLSAPTWEELKARDRSLQANSGARFQPRPEHGAALLAALRRFQGSSAARERARQAGVNKELWPRAAASFRKHLVRVQTPGLAEYVTTVLQEDWPGAEALLWSYFQPFVAAQYPAELEAYRQAVATLDLRAPHSWYPYARAIHRKIIYHGGPTNSGKTYTALQALAAAQRGVYAGPLRLLAMEVYERLNLEGVRCALVTGQEKQLVPGAGHVAATVEMVPVHSHFDVAVIDEIQMIGDEHRGHAWTRALLGLPANEIHVAGDTSAVQLVRSLAEECGDEFELREYDRFSPLLIDTAGLPGGWRDVQPGDCIVSFSRSGIYGIRRAVEAQTGLRCCVVYGSLPAETRRQQARLFNDPASPYKVLIASDAIGMGLNFNIRRVIFSTMTKPMPGAGGSRQMGPVPVSMVKQIAGRAGRRNSAYADGLATTLEAGDLSRLEAAVALPAAALATPAAGLVPEYETFELLSGQMPGLTFDQLIAKFAGEAQLDGTYFFCNQAELQQNARLVQRVPGLTLEDRYRFAMAPVPSGDPLRRGEQALLEFAHTYAAGHPVLPPEAPLPKAAITTEAGLADLEVAYKVLSMWLWLSFRFDDGAFPGREEAMAQSRRLCAAMSEGLAATSKSRGEAAPSPPPPLPSSAAAAHAAAGAAAGQGTAGTGGLPTAGPGQQAAPAGVAEGGPPTHVPGGSSGGEAGAQPPAQPAAAQVQEADGWAEWVDPWLVAGPPPAPGPGHHHALHSAAPPVAGPGAGLLDSLSGAAGGTGAASSGRGAGASAPPASLADIEAALMPEWHSSMGRFMVFKARSRLVVPPPPPQPPEQGRAGGEAGDAGGAGGPQLAGAMLQ